MLETDAGDSQDTQVGISHPVQAGPHHPKLTTSTTHKHNAVHIATHTQELMSDTTNCCAENTKSLISNSQN